MRYGRLVLALAFVTLAGCNSPPGGGCFPGESVSCAGPGGCRGAQVCAPSGNAYGACDCGGGVDAGGTLPGHDAGPSGSHDGGPVASLDAGPGASLDAGPTVPGVDGGVVLPGGDYRFPARDFRCESIAAPPCATTVPVRSDTERTVTLPRDRTPTTLTYVLHIWQLTEGPDSSDRAVGLNLDGLDSGTGVSDPSADCQSRLTDYLPWPLDPSPGIDNAVSVLLPVQDGFLDETTCGGDTDGCTNRMLQQSVDDGDSLVLVVVEGADSLSYDDAVRVTVYEGSIITPTHDVAGRLLAGQTFSTVRTLAATTTGDIFEGRLRVRFASLALPGGTSGGIVSLTATMRRVEVRANISETTLSNGIVAGTFVNEDIVALSPVDQQELVRGFLSTIADIAPSVADARNCTEVSTALTFAGRDAIRTP